MAELAAATGVAIAKFVISLPLGVDFRDNFSLPSLVPLPHPAFSHPLPKRERERWLRLNLARTIVLNTGSRLSDAFVRDAINIAFYKNPKA